MKRNTKICKVCGNEYTPDRPLQMVCSPKCATKYSREHLKAKQSKIKARLYKVSGKTEERLRRKADKLVQKVYTVGLCESCGIRKANCVHHYIYKSQSNFLRYEPKNFIPICNECHTRHHKSGDSEIMSRVIAKRGVEWEQELQQSRRTPCKPSEDYYKEIIERLESQL